MVETMEGVLLDAVWETLQTGSPAPARDRIARVTETDDELGTFGSGAPPGQTFALIVLTRWLGTAGAGADSGDLLDWIGDNLGARYRARSKYMTGVLDPAGEHSAQHGGIDGLVGIPVQGDLTVGVDVAGAFPVLADHRDGAAQVGAVRPQQVAVVDEGDATGLPSPAQWHHETPTGDELVAPRGREVPGPTVTMMRSYGAFS